VKPINLFDYETLAQERVDKGAWGYFQGGSDDEVTMRACRAGFERIRLRPRMLVDVGECVTSTTVLGTPVSLPVLVAPSAHHGLAHAEAECETVRGVGLSRTLMTASTFSNRSLEEIAHAASGPLWLQLYLYRSLDISGKVVQRAEAAGYRAIVLTSDTPVLGRRERDLRNDFHLPPHLKEGNFVEAPAEAEGETPTQVQAQRYLPLPRYPTWATVDWLHTITSLPIILKGLLTAEDALLALEHGAAGIIVSNHGGRQLDGAIASIEALPEIVEAVNGRCEVYLDGGVRRGTDVLKALALGARAVLIGRPALWGLAVDGAQGVHHMLEILRQELTIAMALSGRPTIASIDRSLVKL
jgi:isopentenyl diphosphate isomerase/L-lactate dehydrogenase-like FMN-dependent dehydrogenase